MNAGGNYDGSHSSFWLKLFAGFGMFISNILVPLKLYFFGHIKSLTRSCIQHESGMIPNLMDSPSFSEVFPVETTVTNSGINPSEFQCPHSVCTCF